MDKGLVIKDYGWTEEEYKIAMKMTKKSLKPKIADILVNERIEALPFENLQRFFTELQTPEFRLLPFRVNGGVKSQAEFQMASKADFTMHSFTLYNKHAFANLFVWQMSDTQVQAEPFVQIAIENIYSDKKGYGSRLLQHMIKKAKKHNITLTVWNVNEKLKDYFVSHGFDYHYKSLSTGHYFSTYNLI